MNNFLTENNKSPIADFHAIVTDHPRMRALGLGVFTTGDLNTWLHNLKKPVAANAENPMPKDYSNWTAINHATIDDLLGTKLKSNENWGSFEGWRKHGATGKYEHQEWDEWSWSFDDVSFDHDDLLFDEFWTNIAAGSIMTNLTPDGLEITEGFSYEFDDPKAFGRNFFSGTTSPILQIIEMNRLMTQFKRYYSKTEWHDSKDEHLTSLKLFAMDNFLTDIKASKYGHVEFSGEVPFYINIADGGIQCIQPEFVKYKLYLYDDSKVRNTDKVAVLKDPKIGGYKTDTFGRPIRETVDGEAAEADITNPMDKAIGELEKSWNHYTAKWESGTQNVFAKVVSHINAAVNNPTVESLEHSDIKADLDGDESKHFAPSSGLVMPIEMQNANPMQWQPSYARTSGCREQEKEKATLIGFNYNPLKSYPRDTLVMLSKIGGIWHVTDMGSGISLDDAPVEVTFEGKWQFQYLATNSNSFFTGYTTDEEGAITKNKLIPPGRVECAFHRDYYLDDPVNGGDDLSSSNNDYIDLEAGLVDGEPVILWSKKSVERFYATRGWWQFTSFDFMDGLIGGTHDGNYIASTNCLTDSAGRLTEAPDNVRHPGGGSTGGFFGCVFPDGYTNSTLTFFGEQRDFVVGSCSNYGSVVPDEAQSYMNGLFNTSDGIGSESTKDNPILPFKDPASDYRVVDGDGKWDGKYTPTRSKQRMMLSGGGNGVYITETDKDGNIKTREVNDPEEEINFEDNTFQSISSSYAPSMFFGETHNSRSELKQLPADIGTLSSPSGKYGCPIQNIHALDILHGDKSGYVLQDAVPNIFKERYWLKRQAPLNTAEDVTAYKNDLSSAYGFKPNKMNKIMFRPLKVGTYTQFFPNLKAHVANKPPMSVYIYESDDPPSFDRGDWSAEVVRQYHFKDDVEHTIASRKSQDRELAEIGGEVDRAGVVPPHLTGKNLLHSKQKGLLLRGDIHADGSNINTDTEERSDFHYPSYNGRVHDQHFWNEEIFRRPQSHTDGLQDDDRGGNAFGVIGAVATTTANTEIAFSTQNTIGMRCESFLDNSNQYLEPAWGGPAVNYNTNKTTELHATVYHAHPRSQTIYDPRYFAVHHFNPYVIGASTSKKVDVTFLIQEGDSEGLVKRVNQIDSREVVLDGDKLVMGANRKYEYDLIQPTRFGLNDGDKAITCEVGERVFKDKVFDATGGTLKQLHREDNWNFDDKRLGKLLPYRYTVKVLGAPWPLNETIDVNDGLGGINVSSKDAGGNLVVEDSSKIDPNVTAESLADKMVIISLGKGYSKGDIVGNERMGVLFSVMEVDDFVDAPGYEVVTGVITKLQLYSLGNIAATSCSNSSQEILPDKASGYGYTLKGINTSTGGTGFSAFFVNAKVVEETRIDHKPRVVGTERTYKLSSPADTGTTDSVSNTTDNDNSWWKRNTSSSTSRTVGRDYGLVYGGTEVSVPITSEHKSPDSKYDIFFHFHNDITHTWMDPEYGSFFNLNDVDEQHITTQITAF